MRYLRLNIAIEEPGGPDIDVEELFDDVRTALRAILDLAPCAHGIIDFAMEADGLLEALTDKQRDGEPR